MKPAIKILFSLIIGIIGISIIYIIAKDTFKRSDLIFQDGIKYYKEGIATNSETKFLAAEQCFENEIKFNNEEAYPYMALTKLALKKYDESIEFAEKTLEIDYIKNDNIKISGIYMTIAMAYEGLSNNKKMMEYLKKAAKLGNPEAKQIIETLNTK